jgi:cyclophilin family peptidyl-prolyl cis-trans isomerase
MKQQLVWGILALALIAGGYAAFFRSPAAPAPEGSAPAVSASLPQKTQSPPTKAMPPSSGLRHRVTIQTNLGVLQFDTHDADAPKAVSNFVTLAGKGFYNGLTFHRVIKGFMIQGGDPNCSPNPASDKGPCGAGGPGYQFADELDPKTPSYQTGYKRGVVAMANAGPNTNGSQFFIMHSDYPLPHHYTIFGKLVVGEDVLDRIANAKTGPGDRPVEAVVMEKVNVEVLK